MSTTIFYYTGTGNSLWAARTLTDELGEAELISMPEFQAGKAVNSGIVGLVFPVYIWGVPAPVLRFVNTMKGSRPDYLFAMVTNGGQVSNTLVQLKRVLAGNGLTLSSGFEIKMPSNYIPWGGPGAKDEQNRCFELAQKKITRIAALIKAKADMPVEMGPFWQRILFSAIYKMTFSQVPKMDRQFWTDDKCNSCGICSRVCPAGNISMIEGKPAWKHRCEQCFACLQWCPREAVQYGKKTPQYERYHHPEILLNDVLKSKSG